MQDEIKSDKIKPISSIIINKRLIYPLMFYTAGLIIGTIAYRQINSDSLTTLIQTNLNLKDVTLQTLIVNDISINLVVFSFTMLFGLCLIGFPFVNIIPLLVGIELSLKIACYYTSYGAKGIGYCVLMVIPEGVAFTTILFYVINNSIELSTSIYKLTKNNNCLADSDNNIDLKYYFKKYLIYLLIIVILSVVNSLIKYLLSSIISI